mmetsp:Transcript_17910/g.34463  ORF Transcript_17910/g.34463 Transcript_17910/m.34463 type:complete len:201 (+) Transcript_17910:833-1435(+)
MAQSPGASASKLSTMTSFGSGPGHTSLFILRNTLRTSGANCDVRQCKRKTEMLIDIELLQTETIRRMLSLLKRSSTGCPCAQAKSKTKIEQPTTDDRTIDAHMECKGRRAVRRHLLHKEGSNDPSTEKITLALTMAKKSLNGITTSSNHAAMKAAIVAPTVAVIKLHLVTESIAEGVANYLRTMRGDLGEHLLKDLSQNG